MIRNNRRITGDGQRDGETLALYVARLFPESFTVFGERIAVRNDAGTEATRAMVRAELEQHETRKNSGEIVKEQ